MLTNHCSNTWCLYTKSHLQSTSKFPSSTKSGRGRKRYRQEPFFSIDLNTTTISPLYASPYRKNFAVCKFDRSAKLPITFSAKTLRNNSPSIQMALIRNSVLTFELKTRKTYDISVMLWEINIHIKIKDILISENFHGKKNHIPKH